MDRRSETHAKVGAWLADLDDEQLVAFLRDSGAQWSTGWGATATVGVEGSLVFVKRLPVTALEAGSAFSTRNHHELPTFYNYGVGSAGFGAFREVAAHERTTAWVLDGSAEGFPLLYHRRLLRRFDDMQLGWTPSDRYVSYWAGDEKIASYMQARLDATHEVVLFCEHVPQPIIGWLLDHPDAIDGLLARAFASIDAMRANGMVHFDSHFGNVVTDGVRPCFADLGLALDASFDLSAAERGFLERHQHYDYGLVCWSLSSIAQDLFEGLDEERRSLVRSACGATGELDHWASGRMLAAHIEEVAPLIDERIGPRLIDAIRRYEGPAAYMSRFIGELRAGPSKDAVYDDAVMRGLLVDAGAEV